MKSQDVTESSVKFPVSQNVIYKVNNKPCVSFSANEAQKKNSGQEHPLTATGVCCSRYEEHL